MEQVDIKVGDIIESKKGHPCGGHEWEILRVGVDFKMKCTTCGHMIMIERPKALKMIKKVKHL